MMRRMAEDNSPPRPRRRRQLGSVFDEEEVAARLRKAKEVVAPHHAMEPHESSPDLGWNALTGERRNPAPDDDDV